MGRYKSYGYGSGYSSKGGSYGYGSYGSGSKGYSYGSGWDYWGSYGYESLENDDDLVVKDPVNYTTPTSKEIENKSGVWKKSSVDQIKELARICYFKMIDDRDYFKPEYADFSKLSEDTAAALTQKKEFYDQIFDNYIPGFTPLEQAIAVYNKMKKEAKYQDADDSEESDLMSSAALDFDRDVYTDPNINDQLELNERSKTRKMSVLDKVSIIGDLGTQFKVEKEIDEKIVSNSDTYAKKMMRDYAQIANVDLYQKLFPNFPVKLLTKDLVVNVPVDRKEQKQKIIIIIDFSGSMCCSFKQDWVNAIMIDRLNYVLKGEAEVFFSFFVHNPDAMHFQHIHDRETVMKFWQSFSNEPNGGGTQVGEMVKRIARDISHGKLCNLNIDLSQEKPEILVINDGQSGLDI